MKSIATILRENGTKIVERVRKMAGESTHVYLAAALLQAVGGRDDAIKVIDTVLSFNDAERESPKA